LYCLLLECLFTCSYWVVLALIRCLLFSLLYFLHYLHISHLYCQSTLSCLIFLYLPSLYSFTLRFPYLLLYSLIQLLFLFSLPLFNAYYWSWWLSIYTTINNIYSTYHILGLFYSFHYLPIRLSWFLNYNTWLTSQPVPLQSV
jgi:hypothetical protein